MEAGNAHRSAAIFFSYLHAGLGVIKVRRGRGENNKCKEREMRYDRRREGARKKRQAATSTSITWKIQDISVRVNDRARMRRITDKVVREVGK